MEESSSGVEWYTALGGATTRGPILLNYFFGLLAPTTAAPAKSMEAAFSKLSRAMPQLVLLLASSSIGLDVVRVVAAEERAVVAEPRAHNTQMRAYFTEDRESDYGGAFKHVGCMRGGGLEIGCRSSTSSLLCCRLKG
ncbi:hypothetical protein Nepgr_010381 [Nepenthes gracilis]|uniref:Uncharacterized protein n=1 Tax=Nepenthes gracilis TaxID=150966 RepID=A0AAD3SD18_NEPGR|nr:hypothetical protein Nepgr_010381 [Nepenthes gracilis]